MIVICIIAIAIITYINLPIAITQEIASVMENRQREKEQQRQQAKGSLHFIFHLLYFSFSLFIHFLCFRVFSTSIAFTRKEKYT